MISRDLPLLSVPLLQLLQHLHYLLPHFLCVHHAPPLPVPCLSMASKDAEDDEPQRHGETLQQRETSMLNIGFLSCSLSISNIDIAAVVVGAYSAHSFK